MTRTITANYEVERAKYATAPVYFCDFRHVKSQGAGVDYGFSRHFATGVVASPSVTKLPYMNRVSGNTQTVEPELGRSSIGNLKLEFLDVKADGTNGEMLKYIASGTAVLNGALTAGATTVPITGSTDGYPSVGTIEITTSAVTERIRYTGKTASSFTSCTRGVDGTTGAAHNNADPVLNGEQIRAGQRVVLYAGYGPLAEADYMSFSKMEVVEVLLLADGVSFCIECADILRTTRRTIFLTASETAPVVLTGNPLTLLLQVLISTGAGTNWSGAGTNYDVLSANNGLALPYQLVDIAGIEALRTSDFPSDTYSFSITQPQLGKDFLELEICKTTNCYPLVKQDGKLSLRRYKLNVGTPTGDLLTMNGNNIRAWQWVAGYSRIINVIIFDYDWGITGAKGVFGKREIFTQGASVLKYGKRAPLVIQSRGITTANGGAAIAQARATEVARRFAERPGMLSLSTFYQKHPLEAGDQVPVTYANIPNDRTGLRGFTSEVFETLDFRPNFGPEGGVDLALLWVGSLPTIAAPTSDGGVGTPSPSTMGPVSLESTTLDFGTQSMGNALTHEATFGSGTRASYREAIPAGLFSYVVVSGDKIVYDIQFDATSVDTRGGLDLGCVDRSNTLVAGSTTTAIKLDTGNAYTDNQINTWWVYVPSLGQAREVTGFVASTDVATVSPAFGSAPGAVPYKLIRMLRNESAVDAENSLNASPATQLGSRALGAWYKRTIPVPAGWVGKPIEVAGTGLDNDAAGFVKMAIVNAKIISSGGVQRTSLMGASFSARELWIFGSEANVTTPLAALDPGGHSVETAGVGLLSIGRAAMYRNNTGTGTHSTTETVKDTLTNFVFLAASQDSVRLHLKIAISVTNVNAASSLTLTVRLRRGTTTAGVEVLRAAVTHDTGVKTASVPVAAVITEFDIDIGAAAALPAPGYQSYCLTTQFTATGGGGGSATTKAIKVMGVVRSR